MALLSVIRRWHFRDHLSIRDICRRTGLSRNTIRKYLRLNGVEPLFQVPERPRKLDRFADRLSAWLKTESKKNRKQKRTLKQLHAELMSLGYEGSYNRVAAFAREWKADLQIELQTTGRGTFVPLAFEPGEAFPFDWSEDWAIIGNERTKLQVAHTKLSYSRAFIVRAYHLQTHEMLFDAHNHASVCLAASPGVASTTTCARQSTRSDAARIATSTSASWQWPAITSTSRSFAIRHLAGRRARSRRMFRMPVIGSFNRSRALHRWKPSTTGWSFDARSFGCGFR